MAAVSTGFVGAVRFNFLTEEARCRSQAEFRDHLLLPDRSERSSSPAVLLDSEKEDPELFNATLWPQHHQPVWLQRESDPTDLRHSRPVSRHKLLVLRSPARPRPEWMLGWRGPEVPEDRGRVERGLQLLSQPSTRCEDWSTLRQLLPSRGRPVRSGHRPAWESGGAAAAGGPVMTDRPATSFPRVCSEMTRFCDKMFVNDKNFWNR